METSWANAWTIARLTLWGALRVAYYCDLRCTAAKSRPVVRAPRSTIRSQITGSGCIDVGLASLFAQMPREGCFRLKMRRSLTTEGLRACGSQESYRRASG